MQQLDYKKNNKSWNSSLTIRKTKSERTQL